MNQVKSNLARGMKAAAAMLLLQVNLALAAEPAVQQATHGPASAQEQVAPAAAQATPEAPTPTTSGTATAPPTLAQQMQQAQQQTSMPPRPFHVDIPHSHNPLAPYRPSTAPELDLSNTPRLQSLIRDGKIYLSMHDAIAVAIENNLDLAYFRYNFPIAQTDILRTKSGAQANGVNAVVTQSTQGGFSSSSGAGGGGSSGGSAAAGNGGIVTSTLGAGTSVSSFDPYLNFRGFVDHTTTPEVNQFQVGTPLLKANTIEVLSNFSQSFPIGTNVSATYQGERLAVNSPDFSINPELFSNFQLEISQPILSGFGLATNERFIRIAKRNAQITDLVFKQQVIATVTQVENIYWDLVNAYEAEQISERSLGFANKNLSDDQKQLELQAIPAMQVMTDQSAVAAAEGNLTVARASLRLNELLMKNILTKVDDAAIDEMIPILRRQPDHSILSVLLASGQPIESIRANVKLAISGGQNEPCDAIAGTVWAMLTHPEQLELARRGEVSWLDVFEEYARWIAPIGMSPRRVAKPYSYGGVDFAPEDRVFFMFGSANRDETCFADPDRFDVSRDTQKSIAFGAGPHYCAGAFVSRAMVADVALPGVFARLKGLRLDPSEPVRIGGWAFRGLLNLPVLWDAS